MAQTRQRALSLYRRILRLGKEWENYTENLAEVGKEQKYIKNEARTLFTRHRNLTNQNEIEEHFKEAETRVEMAIHYRNPYPRPIHYPQTVLPSTKRLRGTKKILEQSKPVYVKSYNTD